MKSTGPAAIKQSSTGTTLHNVLMKGLAQKKLAKLQLHKHTTQQPSKHPSTQLKIIPLAQTRIHTPTIAHTQS